MAELLLRLLSPAYFTPIKHFIEKNALLKTILTKFGFTCFFDIFVKFECLNSQWQWLSHRSWETRINLLFQHVPENLCRYKKLFRIKSFSFFKLAIFFQFAPAAKHFIEKSFLEDNPNKLWFLLVFQPLKLSSSVLYLIDISMLCLFLFGFRACSTPTIFNSCRVRLWEM